ncbi:MAG: pilus assembly protein [Chloroflexi bacterium]|nr:MAG: pilus assembly protein [Chloroflexota bacterium]
MMSRARQRHTGQQSHRRRGQALVELALVAPILIVFLLGGSQVGAIAYAQVSLDTAAREGARAGVVAPNSSIQAWDPLGLVPSRTVRAAPTSRA